MLLFSCSPKNYDYEVSISNSEYKIIKKYAKKYKSILKKIKMNDNFIYSDDKELLVKIKNRLTGIDDSNYLGMTYAPIIINYKNKYYYVALYEDDINWLDDNEIYEKLNPGNVSLIDICISDKLFDLDKKEFIEEYFFEEDGIYKSKVNMNYTLFEERNIENDELFEAIVFLSMVKYNFLIKVREHIYISEIIKKPNGT
jgi:hypothetical protein